jgi:hypothetical protein
LFEVRHPLKDVLDFPLYFKYFMAGISLGRMEGGNIKYVQKTGIRRYRKLHATRRYR